MGRELPDKPVTAAAITADEANNMILTLSYAEGPDTSDSGLEIIVIAIFIIAAVGLLAAIPSVIARRRANPHAEGIVAILVIWAMLSAGSAVYVTNATLTWSREFTRQLMSGYRDPKDQSDRPQKPWTTWGVLGVVYVATAAWSTKQKRE